ncbi:MAG: zinc dependent phospholipase C family protein [Eubacteriales bacterium]
MDLKTHLNISNVLMDNLARTIGAQLHPFWFRLGSITPDLHPYHRIQPHHVKHAKKHIEKYLNRIAKNKLGPGRLSLYLGITSHFISDTFCLMHNHETGKKPLIHSRYENQLSRFFASFTDHLCFMSPGISAHFSEAEGKNITEYILAENKRYHAAQQSISEWESMTTDITYTVHTCLNVLTEMLTKKQPQVWSTKPAA